MSVNYAKKIWDELLAILLKEDIITNFIYELWFQNSEGIEMDAKSLTVQTIDELAMNWLNDNYKDLLEDQLKKITGQPISLYLVAKEVNIKQNDPFKQPSLMQIPVSETVSTRSFQSPQQNYSSTINEDIASYSNNDFNNNTQQNYYQTAQNEPPINQTQAPINVATDDYRRNICNLNPRYVFDNFISGSNNNYAYNIARAVAENPGKHTNPMFLYGGSGLGKTHLIQAIGNYILDKNPNSKVMYITSEAFLYNYTRSLNNKTDHEFREKFRNIDVLIVDDIQFLVGKSGLQDEFFHTFNYLHQKDKQIIITSDSRPAELTVLMERLRTRFSWGILVDIHPPELETRIAILHNKINQFAYVEEIPQNVIEYIASHIDTNVRELEGALNSLLAQSSMYGIKEITLELAIQSLQAYTKTSSDKVSIAKIQKIVAKFFHCSTDDLKSKSRKEPLGRYRHVAVYLCKILTDNSLQKIGKQFGGRDHTTIMNSVRKIDAELKRDPDLKAVISDLEKQITS